MRKALLALSLMAAGAAFAAGTDPQSAANIHAHIAFLASDLLKGREAGTPEYDIAAAYVASQMEQLGLKPGAGKSYFQHVPLTAYRPAGQGSLAVKRADGKTVPLVFGADYVPRSNLLFPTLKLDKPMVFVGYGITAPEHGRDDYKGMDVKGKIAVILYAAPKSYQSEERAYYMLSTTKYEAAAAHGAAGVLFISNPVLDKIAPFADNARQYQSWGMTWRKSDGKPFTHATLPGAGMLSMAGARKLFAGAKLSADQVFAAMDSANSAVPSFALPGSLLADEKTEIKNVESENIVGILPGADPKLKNEYVVLSAHLDHIGVTPPVKGDSINNGALDNASGVATTLEVARLFNASGNPPRRSMIFLIDTGEEKGLVGAEYFAHNPTVSKAQIASDVDLDMPVLTYDFTDVTAFGADRSSIGPSVKKAAAGMNIALSPDPDPDQATFVRSDHYRFVEQGIPAVFLATGYANGGKAAWEDFGKNHYHKPSDDLNLPIRYDVGAKFAKLNYAISRELADADARPAWNKGDFFGQKFGKR